jgi:catechol 2,3-dioxygenase-like lactoylglutathione lyase family enzyme
MSILGLDHVQVAAPPGAEPAARRFYGQLLGLPEIEKPEGVRASGGAWFRCGPLQEVHVGIVPADRFVPAQKAHPGLLVESRAALDLLAARLSEAGVAVAWDERIAGVYRCYVDDPWGNRVELRAA